MDKKNCFVIAPINKEDSHERKKINDLINNYFKPLLKDYNVDVSHFITQLGNITTQIISKIYDADLIIADLTGINGNVMYELGVADTLQKPVIVLCEKETTIPFDKSNQRTIVYQYVPYAMENFKADLLEVIKSLSQIKKHNIDNTVTQAIGQEYLSSNINIRSIAYDAVKRTKIDESNKMKIVSSIDNEYRDLNDFNKEKYIQEIENLIESKTQIFGEDITEKNKNIDIEDISFDYHIITSKKELYLKVMKTPHRGTWSKYAKDINIKKDRIKLFQKHNIHIIFIIPMVRTAGKMTNGISLLKYDKKIKEIRNYDDVLYDLNKQKPTKL